MAVNNVDISTKERLQLNEESINSGTIDTGTAFGDRNGYSLTFTGMEPLPFATVADYTAEPFDNTAFDISDVVKV